MKQTTGGYQNELQGRVLDISEMGQGVSFACNGVVFHCLLYVGERRSKLLVLVAEPS